MASIYLQARRLRRLQAAVMPDSAIPSRDEGRSMFPVAQIGTQIRRNRRITETIKRRKKSNGIPVRGYKILQQKKVDVATEIGKKGKKVSVSCQNITERTIFTTVKPANALHSEIEAILDQGVKTLSPVDRHLAVNAIAREKHHAADGIAKAQKFSLLVARNRSKYGR